MGEAPLRRHPPHQGWQGRSHRPRAAPPRRPARFLRHLANRQLPSYLINLAADHEAHRPADAALGRRLHQERRTGIHAREEPQANCLPPGLPRINATPLALQNLSAARRSPDPLRSLRSLPPDLHGWPRTRQRPQPHLARLLNRQVGRRHPSSRHYGIQRQNLVRSSRPSHHRSPARNRTHPTAATSGI